MKHCGGITVQNAIHDFDFYKVCMYNDGKWVTVLPYMHFGNNQLYDRNNEELLDVNGEELKEKPQGWTLLGAAGTIMEPFIVIENEDFIVVSDKKYLVRRN